MVPTSQGYCEDFSVKPQGEHFSTCWIGGCRIHKLLDKAY